MPHPNYLISSITSSLFVALTLSACGDSTQTTEDTDTSTGDASTADMPTTNTPTTNTPTTNVPTTDDTDNTATLDPTTEGITTTGPDTTTTGPDTTTGDTTSGTSTTGDTETTDTETETDTEEPLAEVESVWVTANPANLSADALVRISPLLEAVIANVAVLGDVISIQSVAINGAGDGVVTFDGPLSTGGLIIAEALATNPTDGPLGLGDRVIVGPSTGLIAPKGLELDGPDDSILVADTGAGDIKVFAFAASGDADPTYVVSDLGDSKAVWDVHYDADNDVLFAAGTDGVLQVYADFSVNFGQAGPDRSITPTEGGEIISINLHGIDVVDNMIFLTDVGDPADNTDGQIFIIANADTVNGEVDVAQRIVGGTLGNPVDLEVREGLVTNTLYVVEKANDTFLIYNENLITGDYELDSTTEMTKPESVALTSDDNRLIVARNPAALINDAAIEVTLPLIGDPEVTATLDRLGSITSIQSLALSTEGHGYVTFDGLAVSGGAGVFTVESLTDFVEDGQVLSTNGRIWGPTANIVAPKAIALDASGASMMISDLGAADLKIYTVGTIGDEAPLLTVSDLGGGGVWDAIYDEFGDTVYAAGVNGTVRAFDDFMVNGGLAGPSRIITLTDARGQVIGVNLHGIHYDALSNMLILTDVGDAGSNTDGWIYVVADANVADGEVAVRLAIGGDDTVLGNPVDLAFDGANVYIAEKANSAVLRYDNILELEGFLNFSADYAIDVPNPESVQLNYTKP